MHPGVHSSTIYSSQDMEAICQSQPIDRWMAKENEVLDKYYMILLTCGI